MTLVWASVKYIKSDLLISLNNHHSLAVLLLFTMQVLLSPNKNAGKTVSKREKHMQPFHALQTLNASFHGRSGLGTVISGPRYSASSTGPSSHYPDLLLVVFQAALCQDCQWWQERKWRPLLPEKADSMTPGGCQWSVAQPGVAPPVGRRGWRLKNYLRKLLLES